MPAPDAAALVEQYYPLANSIANRWASSYPSLRDEFRSEAAYALWRVALKFEEGRVRFATVVHVAVRRRFVEVLRKERRRFPAAFHQPADDTFDPLDLVPDHRADGVESLDLQDLITAADLNPADAAVMQGFLAGKTLVESAAGLGVTRTRAGQRRDRAVGKLKQKARVPA